MKCKQCNGFGRIILRTIETIKCDMCNGSGIVDSNNLIWQKQGELLKNFRLKQLLTLRQAGLKYGVDYSNLSKMERGVIQPIPYYLTLKQ